VKVFCFLFALAVVSIPAASIADVGIPVEQPTATAEVLTIGASAMTGLLNVSMMAKGKPSYLAGGIGIGLGATTLAFTAVKNPAHQQGLFMGGVFSLATGLFAIQHRHLLNVRGNEVSLTPAWHDGAPALAFSVDF
jgi:hypothetical protein